MPRWAEKDKPDLTLVTPEQDLEQDYKTMPLELTSDEKLEAMSKQVADIHASVCALNVQGNLIAATGQVVKIQRRRTEDEMRSAVRHYATGGPRNRDDEHEQVLDDTINELLSLRQITMDLMQSFTMTYQKGLTAIRSMTDR